MNAAALLSAVRAALLRFTRGRLLGAADTFSAPRRRQKGGGRCAELELGDPRGEWSPQPSQPSTSAKSLARPLARLFRTNASRPRNGTS